MLYKNAKNLSRVRKVYDLLENVPNTNRYDRVTSSAALEHIENLPYVVAKSATLLNEGGTFRASVPSEGGFLWKMGYTFTTGLEFKRKFNLDYSVIMRHEHVNTASEIEEVIRYFFTKVKRKRFGVGKHLSLYTFFEGKNPDLTRCKEYLSAYVAR